MAQDWSIQARSHSCQGCARGFADGEACLSALYRDPPGFVRLDLCVSCWQERERDPQSDPPFSLWKSIYQSPPPPEEEPLKKETAESLLRRLLEQEDPADIPVLYILALMLERKKMLLEQDVQVDDDGTLRRIYEYRGTGEVFVIVDPRFDLDALESVQQQVVMLLGAGDAAAAKAEEAARQASAAGGDEDAPDTDLAGETPETVADEDAPDA